MELSFQMVYKWDTNVKKITCFRYDVNITRLSVFNHVIHFCVLGLEMSAFVWNVYVFNRTWTVIFFLCFLEHAVLLRRYYHGKLNWWGQMTIMEIIFCGMVALGTTFESWSIHVCIPLLVFRLVTIIFSLFILKKEILYCKKHHKNFVIKVDHTLLSNLKHTHVNVNS